MLSINLSKQSLSSFSLTVPFFGVCQRNGTQLEVHVGAHLHVSVIYEHCNRLIPLLLLHVPLKPNLKNSIYCRKPLSLGSRNTALHRFTQPHRIELNRIESADSSGSWATLKKERKKLDLMGFGGMIVSPEMVADAEINCFQVTESISTDISCFESVRLLFFTDFFI